jgi:antitoxin HigA-1
MKIIPYPHPGETLKEDFMEPLGLTPYRVAKDLGVSQTAIGEILSGQRAVSPEMALRLEAYTGASAQFWINLQSSFDLAKVKADKTLIRKLHSIHPVSKAA